MITQLRIFFLIGKYGWFAAKPPFLGVPSAILAV
jgi:hypothetical protein